MDNKQFGAIVILVVAGMQLYAWFGGHNGTVFAFTSLLIGLTAGKILDFKFKKS